MVVSNTVRQVLLGVGVGVGCMLLSATIMLIILISRRKYLSKGDKSIIREPIPVLGNWPGLQDMSRTVAFNRRSFHADSFHRASSTSFDPTLRPFHGNREPYFQRDHHREVTPGDTHSSRRGTTQTPYREAVIMPSAYGTYAADGRMVSDTEDNSGSNGSRSRLFPPARITRLPRAQLTPNSEQPSSSEENRGRAWQRNDGFWRNRDNAERANDSGSSSDGYSDNRPLTIRAEVPPSPLFSHFEFPREDPSLDDVYY